MYPSAQEVPIESKQGLSRMCLWKTDKLLSKDGAVDGGKDEVNPNQTALVESRESHGFLYLLAARLRLTHQNRQERLWPRELR